MTNNQDQRSVFVVHGRNDLLRRAMFDFLRSINLNPIEWTQAIELTGQGSPYIGQVLDVAFDHAAAIVVLMTPDEVAYLQPRYGHGDDDTETSPSEQARPNVLFEAGMALGRDAKRTVLVEIGSLRPFSDVAGRHAVRLNNSLDSRQALAQRLSTAGCDVIVSGTDWHSVGDFAAPEPVNSLPRGRRLPTTSSSRPAVDIHLRYVNKGGNKVDKLQVINRGTETAFDVSFELPEEAALQFMGQKTIPKIPGGGKSVTIDVLNYARSFGGHNGSAAFEIAVVSTTHSGETVEQNVFIDLNG
jgi:hypothetical protein